MVDGYQPPICDYEGSTYRTDFWEGQGREYEDGAERRALARLLPPCGRRLVDIGAGFGRLADAYDGYDHVILMDYSRSQLEFARSRLGDERFTYVAADIYRLPLAANAVDTAVMVRVLHHLVDPVRAFCHIHRIVRPAGTFVLEYANKRHLKNVARYVLGKGVSPFSRNPYEFAPLHYDYHPRWVTNRLREAGFEPGKRLAVSSLRVNALKNNIPTDALVDVDAFLQPLLAPCVPSPSVFVRNRVRKDGDLALAPADQIFACPECGYSPLIREGDEMVCPTCSRRYRIENGVYIFKEQE